MILSAQHAKQMLHDSPGGDIQVRILTVRGMRPILAIEGVLQTQHFRESCSGRCTWRCKRQQNAQDNLLAQSASWTVVAEPGHGLEQLM